MSAWNNTLGERDRHANLSAGFPGFALFTEGWPMLDEPMDLLSNSTLLQVILETVQVLVCTVLP